MHQNEERILLRGIEVRRQDDHVVNALAVFVREPEVLRRLPVELLRLLDVEVGQVLMRLNVVSSSTAGAGAIQATLLGN